MPTPLAPLDPQSVNDALLTTMNTAPRDREQDYGYLSYRRHVVLGLDEVDRLVRTVTDELGTRGLTTPFLFSSLALDITSSGVRRLIEAFLRTCVAFPALDAEYKCREEARFAAPPELAMYLRWGIAPVLRVSGGHAARGLISWDMYVDWSEAEICKPASSHVLPSILITPFGSRLSYHRLRGAHPPLHQPLPSLIFNVLSLLACLMTHSSSSGHTPRSPRIWS